MGVITVESEFAVSIPAAKLFNAFAVEADTVVPKVLAQAVQSYEVIEGNGGQGTIRKITFAPEGKYIKSKVETLDEENLTYSFSLIEANVWKDGIEKITYEHKIVPTPEGGSICKRTSTYYTNGDVDIEEDKTNEGNMTAGLFKAIEAYVSAN